MKRLLAVAAAAILSAKTPVLAGAETPPEGGFTFSSIEGGEIALAALGGPVLVVNTASMCGFTPQYSAMQELWDAYRDKGLTVLAVPSDDFAQEYDSNQQVKEFCEVNYGLTFPIAEITHVKGAEAHPFYLWLKAAHGEAPGWNFNKALVDREGKLLGFWGSRTAPMSEEIVGAVEKALAGS